MALARVQPKTVFARIHDAEHKAARAQERARARQDAAQQNQQAIEDALKARALISRASARLQQQSHERQRAWATALRRVERERLSWAPGQASDVAALLRHAEPLVHQRQAQEYLVLEDHQRQSLRVLELVTRQSSLLVELAQHRADAQTAQAEQEAAKRLASGADASTIERDLDTTSEQLAKSLGLALKNPSKDDFHRLKGALIPPLRVAPTHLFGPRRQGKTTTYVRHSGYTYQVPPGAPVRAVGPGLVVFAGWLEGYGQVVILDHGGGYHSVYAHLATLAVQVGQAAQRADTLATTGSSGSLEGPKLYFELRKDGTPVNPADWFIR